MKRGRKACLSFNMCRYFFYFLLFIICIKSKSYYLNYIINLDVSILVKYKISWTTNYIINILIFSSSS